MLVEPPAVLYGRPCVFQAVEHAVLEKAPFTAQVPLGSSILSLPPQPGLLALGMPLPGHQKESAPLSLEGRSGLCPCLGSAVWQRPLPLLFPSPGLSPALICSRKFPLVPLASSPSFPKFPQEPGK